ncbi:hypothetical protein RMCBS344292_02507 [Rhizopus microsporus]|nr:hypothetical protein RMCBS344292_02507 [Rhizopus microsporus]
MELPNVDPPSQLSNKKTIGNVPRDEATREKIVTIINHQFDLEIYLKQKEIATIKQEITRAESILSDLKQAIKNESMASSMPESSHYTRRSAMYQNGLFPQPLPSTPTTPKRKVYRNPEKNQLYGRRHDGVYVSLACPACHRGDFANQQGFLNHCRISHNLEFGPYEQMLLKCGTPVDESEVPLDSPARLRPILSIIPAASKPTSKKLERPSIKVFEEDVDLELETNKKATDVLMDSTPTGTPTAYTPTMETSAADTPTVSTPTVETSTAGTSTVGTSTVGTPTVGTPTAGTPTAETPTTGILKEQSPVTDQAVATSIDKEDENKETETSSISALTNGQPNVEANKSEESNAPTVESVAAAVRAIPASSSSSLASTADIGSRFYIKRRIIVGNVSKFISPERRDPLLKQFTHKWMIYVVEPPQTKQEDFITCVRFHLHPSYKPHNVVDVTEPPFKLTRLGWGEFPIRIQLFFVDKRRNKSVDIIHHLKLDDTHSGKQMLGSERSIEIELDRNTDFTDKTTISPMNTPTLESPAVLAVKQKMSLLGGILKEAVQQLPLVRAGSSHGKALPYSCVPSAKAFIKLPVGKRKAIEWHRARLLRLETQKKAFETNDNVLRIAAEALSTKDVLTWCVQNKYTPTKTDTDESTAETTVQGFCKFCGSLRDGHDETVDDQCPRRPKGWNTRKRNGVINSTTSVSRLLNQLEPGWDESNDADELDIDVDMDEQKPKTSEEEIQRRRRDGNLQGPTSDFDLPSAMEQRLLVGNLLTQATRTFLKKLITKTVDLCHEQEQGSADKSIKMMVPYHIYQTVQNNEEFDFLSNQYMGTEEP